VLLMSAMPRVNSTRDMGDRAKTWVPREIDPHLVISTHTHWNTSTGSLELRATSWPWYCRRRSRLLGWTSRTVLSARNLSMAAESSRNCSGC
jgi:hypothetical protein